MLIRACDFELNLQYIRSAALNCRYDKNKKAVLSQGNRAMQRIFVTMTLDCYYFTNLHSLHKSRSWKRNYLWCRVL